MTIEALEERMLELEEVIIHSTNTVGNMHTFMDQMGVPIPDMTEHIAASYVFGGQPKPFFSDLSTI